MFESIFSRKPDPRPAIEPAFRKQRCPACGRDFELWHDETGKPETLIIDSCLSAGVYGVSIRCPHCKYEEEIK